MNYPLEDCDRLWQNTQVSNIRPNLAFCFSILDSMATNENKQLPKNILLIEDYLRNISIKSVSRYLKLVGSKCHFQFYKSMETLSCHSIQTKEPIFMNPPPPHTHTQIFNPPARGCHRYNLGLNVPVASEQNVV